MFLKKNEYQVAVTKNTSKCFCLRISVDGTAQTQIAIIMNRLKAAEPTIVLGPKSPASKPLPTTSIIDNKISGAEEPLKKLVDLSFKYT